MTTTYSTEVCERQPPRGVAAAQFSSLWPTDITIGAVMMMIMMMMNIPLTVMNIVKVMLMMLMMMLMMMTMRMMMKIRCT